MTRRTVLPIAAALFLVQTAALLPLLFAARVAVGLAAVALCAFGLWHTMAPIDAPVVQRVDVAARPRLAGLTPPAPPAPPPGIDPATGEVIDTTPAQLERLEARTDELRRDLATLRAQLTEQAQLVAMRLAALEAQQ